MAWNEPGGGKDNDPWGGRGGDQGPPDLDEAFKKLQAQLRGLFGGRGGGGSGGGRGVSSGGLGLLALFLVVAYIGLGVYQIDLQERGVIFRFGKVLDEVSFQGLHWNPPIIDRVVKVNVTQIRNHSHRTLMLTEDENIIDVSLTVQYVVGDAVAFLTQVKNPEQSLSHATESALRHVIGSSLMDDAITDGRAAIGLEVQNRLQSYLTNYGTGITISKVNVDETGPPNQVKNAFNDVQNAKEDEQRKINQANAHAEQVIPESRGTAQQQIEQASAYRDQVIARAEGEADRFTKLLKEYLLAKRVTRDRLYIDAIEEVMSNASKVMVDVEGGNNLLYLPLDRLTQGAAAALSRQEADLNNRRTTDNSSTRRRETR